MSIIKPPLLCLPIFVLLMPVLGAYQMAMAHDCVMPKVSDEYDGIECVLDGLIKVAQNGKYGMMDDRGIIIVPIMFDEIGQFNHQLARVKYREKFGFINHQGLLVVPLKYDDVGFFKNGMALVRKEDEYFMVDGQGQRVLDDAPAPPMAKMDVATVDLIHELLFAEPLMPEPNH